MKFAKSFVAIFIFTVLYEKIRVDATAGRPSALGNNNVAATRTNTKASAKAMKEYKKIANVNKVFRKYFQKQFSPKGIKDRCKQSPAWDINGTYPVLEEVKKGNAVFLFLMKRSCERCWYEIQTLNDWAKWFKTVGAKAKIIVLNHRNYGRLPYGYTRIFRYITFIEEPRNKNIFRQLKGKVYDILMYDQCGRHVYHYGYPWSSMWKPYVEHAMKNTLNHWKSFCDSAPCEPIVIPTIQPPVVIEESPPEVERSPLISRELPTTPIEEAPPNDV